MEQTKLKTMFAVGFGLGMLLLLIVGTLALLDTWNLTTETISIISLMLGGALLTVVIGAALYLDIMGRIAASSANVSTHTPQSDADNNAPPVCEVVTAPPLEKPPLQPGEMSPVVTLIKDAADQGSLLALTIELSKQGGQTIDKITSQHVVDALAEIAISEQSTGNIVITHNAAKAATPSQDALHHPRTVPAAHNHTRRATDHARAW
jgi:hypothetical protein